MREENERTADRGGEAGTDAHADCRRRVTEAMLMHVPVIAVHNTFVRQWEIAPYRRLAEEVWSPSRLEVKP
jgi:hypothetical protein